MQTVQIGESRLGEVVYCGRAVTVVRLAVVRQA